MHSILFQVLRGNWYIDPDFAKSSGFLISQMLKGQLSFSGEAEKFKPSINSYNSNAQGDSDNQKVSAIISITGPMMKHDQYCGPAGMDSIGHWIKEMDNDPSVESIILKLSTPGGTVEGTAKLGKIISETKKPVIAFIDELACSGGYWIASQCDRIIASTARARVGSIGVMLSFADMQPAWEKEGVIFHEIYSTLSSDKNKDFQEIRDGKYDNYRKEVLDPLAKDFTSLVKEKRNITDESILKGKVVFAIDAIDIGLVDAIGTLEEAIGISFDIADEQRISAIENNQLTIPYIKPDSQNLSDMKKFPLLAALLSFESLEVTKDGAHLQQDWLQIIEDAISQSDAHVDTIAERDSTIETLNDEATAREAKISELNEEIQSLRSAAGSQTATVTSNSDIESNKEVFDEMTEKLNATDDMSERIEIMREYGYGK